MPAKRLSMRKIKDVLRLCWGQGLSKRQTARSCGISRPAVDEYLRRAEAAGLGWPLPAEMDDGALERLLFPPPPALPDTARGVPDWSEVHRELKRPGVTLQLLWHEYRQTHPHGYQYTWFCRQYRAWAGKLDLVMRQVHRAGEKLFVDYAGMRAQVINPATGEVREANIFVAALGASNYTYAEATWTQGLEDWIGAHVRCFTYFGGVPEVVVPDNLRAGVSKAHRYEPDINPTYQDLATHYGVAIVPARVRRPRDKAKAEVAVQVVERWILAALRHRQCFSLAELNRAIRALLETLNNRPFKKLPGTRRALFEQLDKPALRPLPVEAVSNTPSGSRPGSTSTITSRCTAITTPCPMRSSKNKWTCASPPTPSSASIAASASPAIDVPATRRTIPPSRPTCPSHTARPASGPRNAWGAGRRRSGRPQKPLSSVS